VLSASADGYKPISVRIAVEGGSDQVLRLPLEALPQMQSGVPAIDPTAPPPQEQPAPPPPEPEPAPKAREGGPDYQTFAIVALVGAVGFGAASGVLWLIGDGQ
jgi:hypothetical protein